MCDFSGTLATGIKCLGNNMYIKIVKINDDLNFFECSADLQNAIKTFQGEYASPSCTIACQAKQSC